MGPSQMTFPERDLMPPVVVEDEIVLMNSSIVWSLHKGRHLLGGEGSLLQGNSTQRSDSNHHWGFHKTALSRLNEVTGAVRKFYKSSSLGRAGSPVRLTSSVHWAGQPHYHQATHDKGRILITHMKFEHCRCECVVGCSIMFLRVPYRTLLHGSATGLDWW
jgi:hypothetical protein